MRNSQINNALPKIFGEAIDSLFNTSLSDIIGSDFSMTSPSVNVMEKEDKYLIEVAAPGLKKEDFNIELENNRLKISSRTESEVSEKSDAKENFVRREYNYESFIRSFSLPDFVDVESINAKYKDGILKIQIMKLEQAIEKGPKSIDIK